MTTPVDPGFLGYQPTIEPLKLTTGASFVQVMQPSSGTFGSGASMASVTLVITDASGNPLASWPATVTSTTASWSVPNSLTDPIPANSRYTMLVSFPTVPPTTYAWYEGPVLRT